MASSLIKLATINNLTPGASKTSNWNNATPPNAVWYIQAVPLDSSFTSSPLVQTGEVEVTRVWRKLNRTPSGVDVPVFNFEHEIWFIIKNIGTKELDVDVYASIIS